MWYPQGSLSDEQLYTQCQQLLSAGQPIELRWDCGGDEAIIYLMKKSKSLNETNPEFVSSLTLYLANYLELPDVYRSRSGLGIQTIFATSIYSREVV
ncbi:MAG: hypothetical protein AAFO02_21465, partial [Bacteroidota bacterium]